MGEPVAAVCAATRELARDAAELVEVEYEPLPVVVDGEGALERTSRSCTRRPARTSCGRASSTGATRRGARGGRPRRQGSSGCTSTVSRPRRSSARARSSSTRRRRGSGRSTAITRCRASGRSGWGRRCAAGLDKLRFVTARHRRRLRQQDLPPSAATACCLLARKLNRPIQWTEWRTDQHMANSHGNERTFLDVEVAVRSTGRCSGFKVRALDDCGAFPRYEPLGCIIWAQVTPGLYRWKQHPRRLHAGGDEQVCGVAEPRLLADAAPVADRADHGHRRRASSGSTPSRCASELHQRRGDAVRDAERLRLRLRRLRALPRHRARPDRLRQDRGAAGRGRVSREAARHRDRLDARLGDEQLRPVAAAQPGAPVLGQQRGGHDQAGHLRRDGRDARHGAAGSGPRDGGGAGGRGHPRLLARPHPRPSRATTRG